ncbi:uncharacterized protein LOC143181043 [Calliopsis andreniformis]|uniref:uncharacterized protein LOC143181043 n=1 Tax=Calliopsis andreniformis TaxID=337506 RepID=UPI003FCD5E25
MDERVQAISFTNNYFALVDGLASGLESRLSENVVLDWFGRQIKGRRNVTAFMETHKVTSRHIFVDIVPSTGIEYKKRQRNRKKFRSYYSCTTDESLKAGIDKNNSGKNKITTLQESSSTGDVVKDINQNDIDTKGITMTDEDMTYDLSEGDLNNLFKLEISSTNIEEIEQSINRIKLEEEMAPTIKVIKRECGQGDGPVIVETSSVKYVEANGEIEFSRKFWKEDARNAYFSATSKVHTWRRSCKLQIAYSTLADQPVLEEPQENKKTPIRFFQPKVRLPSLEEINEISNRLVPNTNKFGGFLKPVDFFQDRKEFLQNLSLELELKDSCTPTFAPKYVKNKLVYSKPRAKATDREDMNKKVFVFNYQIHLIIYESNNKCRVNLLDEFENTKLFVMIYYHFFCDKFCEISSEFSKFLVKINFYRLFYDICWFYTCKVESILIFAHKIYWAIIRCLNNEITKRHLDLFSMICSLNIEEFISILHNVTIFTSIIYKTLRNQPVFLTDINSYKFLMRISCDNK